jgi:ABC-type uncharacterized transport system auxiliary subunit
MTILAAVAAVLSGCVSFTVPAPPTQEYVLDYAPPSDGSSPLPAVLRLAHLAIASPYARSGIMYRTSDHEIGAYTYHQWVTDPAAMVGDLLARDFADAGHYRAVLNGPSRVRPDYELSGTIEEMEERLDDSRGTAHLQIRVLLRRLSAGRENEVVFQKTYTADEPTPGDSTGELVAAMSRSLQRISESLRADVHQVIASDLSQGSGVGNQRSVAPAPGR